MYNQQNKENGNIQKKNKNDTSCIKPNHIKLDGTKTMFSLDPPTYAVGSKGFRPDIQKPRQMENAVRDI